MTLSLACAQARRLQREQQARSQHIWTIKTRDQAKRDWDATYRRS